MQIRSRRVMQELQPQLQEIQKKYKMTHKNPNKL